MLVVANITKQHLSQPGIKVIAGFFKYNKIDVLSYKTDLKIGFSTKF